MRRLSKPWPPTNVSRAGEAPRSFTQAETDLLAALAGSANRSATARTEFDRVDKAKLREVMYREQSGLCVFCEQQVTAAQPEPRIDHWRPLALNPDLALHWRNLHLSCPMSETCDDAKGGRPLKVNAVDDDLPWPADFDYERHIGFGRRGEIYVRSDTALDASTREALRLAVEHEPDARGDAQSILNLNHPALVAARKAVLDSEMDRLQRDFEGDHATHEDREQRATTLLQQDPLPPFVSIRVSWLRKHLGKGK